MRAPLIQPDRIKLASLDTYSLEIRLVTSAATNFGRFLTGCQPSKEVNAGSVTNHSGVHRSLWARRPAASDFVSFSDPG